MKKKLNVVILEDDKEIAEEIAFRLSLFEMNTVIFHCIADFDVYLAQNKPMDILILDLGLPDGDGIEVAKRLANYQHLRIVMLTARSGEKERIEGFQAGGDVYLTKPVSLDELSIVVKRLSDRLPTATDLMANWLFDPLRDTLTLPCGKSIALSTQESMMVQLFVSSEQQIVTREMFQNVIWRREDDITNQRLLVNIGRLRTKLKLANKDEEVIKTHWNIGYQFLYPLEIVM